MFDLTSRIDTTMGHEVLYSPDALADLDKIWEWIAVENEEPASASSTIDAILDRIDDVATFPNSAPPLDTVCQIHSSWRFVSARGYMAFFRVGRTRLYVDRILSSKSDFLRVLLDSSDGIDLYN